MRSISLFWLVAVISSSTISLSSGAELEEVFAWKELEFIWPNDSTYDAAVSSGAYVPENNLPLGLDRWNDKLFITIPRWKDGVAASLAYVSLSNTSKTPAMIPYPNLAANTLPEAGAKVSNDSIISTFRVRVDDCDRLWVMDTGLADILGSPHQYAKPALVIYDLKTDKLVRRYTFKDSDSAEDSFFANVAVDVTKDTCDQAFAYIPDLGGYGVVVYDFAKNDSWRVKHNFFYFDPLNGDYNIGGVNFQWKDGVFGLALSPIQADGYRTMYFHALSSTREFMVSTEILRNKTMALDPHNYYKYKLMGDRGVNTQSSANFFDEKSEILFYTQVNRDGVACWNSKKPFVPENLPLIAADKEKLVFPNDLKTDREGNLWVLSDRMPVFIYQKLDSNQINYRILKGEISKIVSGTPCAA